MMALTNSRGEPWGRPPIATWFILNPIWEFTELQDWGSASFLSDSLKSGETLPQPSNLESPNGMYKFAFQDDDNLVIYDIYDRVIWKTDTTDQCQDASAELVFQTNGNLELLCGDSKLWESGTATDVNVAARSTCKMMDRWLCTMQTINPAFGPAAALCLLVLVQTT